MRFEYDFRIEGRPVGTYVLEDDGAQLRQLVDFQTEEGGYRNEYRVRYRQGRPAAYRVGTADWVDCSDAPSTHWPTAAYPLLLRAEVTDYMAIDEETGHTSPRTLEYAGGRVVERQADRVVRAFELRGNEIVHIDWGGATSELQAGRSV